MSAVAVTTPKSWFVTSRPGTSNVGVFVELGSAASVAGLLHPAAEGTLPRGSRVVCTVTGHGLKDPEWAISTAPSPTTIANDVLLAARALDLA